MDADHTDSKPQPKGLKAIAALEFAKGVIAILVGIGFLATLGDNWGIAIETLLKRLAPSADYSPAPLSFLETFGRNQQIGVVAFMLCYAAIRLVEAFGLWKCQTWAEWLGAVSGGLYIPLEVYECIHRPNGLTFGVLAVNIVIVVYLFAVIKESESARTKKRPNKASLAKSV